MFVLAVELGATLLGCAAIISAIGGCATTILAIHKARDEETEKCVTQLRECRAEAEKLAAELHELKMDNAN